jgi:PAS domain-containing protein
MRRIGAYVETLQQRLGLMKLTRTSTVDGEANSNKPRLSMVMRRIGAYIEALQQRIRFLEAVVQNFPGGISVYDHELRMVLCNDRQKRLLDYPPELFAKGMPTMEELFRSNAERGEYVSNGVQN